MTENENLLEMKNIIKRFGHTEALKGVDFEVGEQEIIGVVGDNGAGKSTLMNIICGYLKQSEGEVYYKGEEISKYTVAERRKNFGIETVYQDKALGSEQSVVRNFFMVREITDRFGFLDLDKMKEEVMKVLDEIGFLRIDDPEKKVKYLSGGERAGISIARAMYFDADLLILDEPTIALSLKETQQILDFLEQAKSEGISSIVVSHAIDTIYPIIDRVVVLGLGEKVLDRSKEETDKETVKKAIIGMLDTDTQN